MRSGLVRAKTLSSASRSTYGCASLSIRPAYMANLARLDQPTREAITVQATEHRRAQL
ncbi:hypothetical protein AQB9606_00372 [Aquabacterium sp. CECT 9606]|nr:hypothetical protein AQB9606_00372 [Aquabacterium sp. CECT 9606]